MPLMQILYNKNKDEHFVADITCEITQNNHKHPGICRYVPQNVVLLSEHVRGVGAAKLPVSTQTYFSDSYSLLRHLPLPLQSMFSHPLTAPLPLIQFSARSAPFSALILVMSLCVSFS